MQNKINNNPESKFQTLNSISKFQTLNSQFHSGITLIILVVTIVILLILAGVTISVTLGDNGLWKNVNDNARNQEKQIIKTQIEIIATNWVTQKTLNDAVTEDDLKQEYVNEEIVASKDKVEGGNGDFQITTIKGYVYHLIIDIQGNVTVEYIGMEGEVSSKIGYLTVTQTTTNSITVEIKLKNPSETYQFTYSYKKQEDETYTTIEPSSTSNTYTFTGLKSYQVYDLKVIVVSGEESTELKTSAITTNVKSGAVKQAEGSPIWNSSTRTAIVKLEATIEMPAGSKIQYKINGEEPWKDYSDQINGLNHGDSISARIYSEVEGVLGEGNILVEDSIEPKPATIVLSSEETTPSTAITATVTHTDDETGINIQNCKWVYTVKEGPIGTQDANLGEYTGSFSSNGQTLTLTADAEGTYYLHVLSVDIAGNRKETISSGVVVEASKLPTVSDLVGKPADTTQNITAADKNGNPITIPAGFIVLPNGEDGVEYNHDTENHTPCVEDGIVIQDADGNQFVWVPVNTTQYNKMIDETNKRGNLYNFTTSGTTKIEYTTTSKFREPDIVTTYRSGTTSYIGDDSSTNFSIADIRDKNGNLITGKEGFKELLQTEFDEMSKSVKEYNGFYIGRYETGDFKAIKNTIPIVKRGATSGSDVSWYYRYANSKNIAKNNKYSTSMIWGCQFDRTLEWIVTTNGNDWSLVTSPNSWGNFSNSVENASTNSGTRRTTGYNEAWKKNNIYDLAGNANEWILTGRSQWRSVRRWRSLL